MRRICNFIARIGFLFVANLLQYVKADNYAVASDHKSLMVAMGCFWCGEESFERYGPGVIEAVSGYAGGSNKNPTYGNHPGHYEVVLVEYDPKKTSYITLMEYAWRNIDPFDGDGQFCDSGSSYRPAIFYKNEEEKAYAESLYDDILNENPTWQANSIAVPILERPTFWKAEDYHQDYYIKNPGDYAYYKELCGREKRLKYIWGEDVYDCYHDLAATCFNGTVTNANGTEVEAETNIKNAPEAQPAILPVKYWFFIVFAVLSVIVIIFVCRVSCKKK